MSDEDIRKELMGELRSIRESVSDDVKSLRNAIEAGYREVVTRSEKLIERVGVAEVKLGRLEVTTEAHIKDKGSHEKGYYLALIMAVITVLSFVAKGAGIF